MGDQVQVIVGPEHQHFAASRTAKDCLSSAVQPNTLPPRQSGKTSRDVVPIFVMSPPCTSLEALTVPRQPRDVETLFGGPRPGPRSSGPASSTTSGGGACSRYFCAFSLLVAADAHH